MSDFHVVIREARPHERRQIERTAGALASDHCVTVRLGIDPFPDTRLVGWGDDYGTFHVSDRVEDSARWERLNEAGEKLLEAANEFWAEHVPPRPPPDELEKLP